jgi:hypothetical protein
MPNNIVLKMDGIELRVEMNQMRTHDWRLNGQQNWIERREPMNQDQEWRNHSESPKSEKPGQRRTQKNNPQDVKERRESNRRPMTNFIENGSHESNWNHLTNVKIQNQKVSNQGPVNAMERPTIGARARKSSTQRNEKHTFPRVPVPSKGAKLELNRSKTTSLCDLAKCNSQAPHQLELSTASLEPSQKEQKGNEQTEKPRGSTKHNQDQKSVEAKRSMLCCKGVLDFLPTLSRPVQPTSSQQSMAVRFSMFSLFLDLEKSQLGAQHSLIANLLVTKTFTSCTV